MMTKTIYTELGQCAGSVFPHLTTSQVIAKMLRMGQVAENKTLQSGNMQVLRETEEEGGEGDKEEGGDELEGGEEEE